MSRRRKATSRPSWWSEPLTSRPRRLTLRCAECGEALLRVEDGGWRPPFQFPGWWLYADDDTPILHVIHRDPLPQKRAGVLDHMAFSAKDLPGTVETLKREGIEYELRRLPGGGIWQLFFSDPHGAKVEFDFHKDEPAPAGYAEA